jgi:hypothetical protein
LRRACTIEKVFAPLTRYVTFGESWRNEIEGFMRIKRQQTDEAAILGRVLQPGKASLLPLVAEAFLSLDFQKKDQARIEKLAAKAQSGTLTTAMPN